MVMKKRDVEENFLDKFDIEEVEPEIKQHVKERIKLLTEKTDILDFVKDYRDERIIQHLRANGIDGFKVQDILRDNFGLSGLHGAPVSYTREERARDKKIEYAMRDISKLCKSSLLAKGEVSVLRKIETRLKKISFRFSRDTIDSITAANSDSGAQKSILHLGSSGSRSLNSFKIKIKNGKASLDLRPDAPCPISTKQRFGVQMVALFDYIQQFNHGQYINKEIFGLIATLFKKMNRIEFNINQIKKFIENNKIIYKKINSTRKTTKSKNARTSIKS